MPDSRNSGPYGAGEPTIGPWAVRPSWAWRGSEVRLTMPALEPYQLPVRPYPRLFRWVLRWLQRRCKHYALKADILEGSGGVYAIRWCETCGAWQRVIDGTPCGVPRLPEPTWEVYPDPIREQRKW